MTITWVVAGFGLLLLGVPDQRRSRLRWLAATRLASSDPEADPQRVHARRRPRRLPGRIPGPARITVIATVLATGVGAACGPVPAVLAAVVTVVGGWCAGRLATERRRDRDLAALNLAVTALGEEYAAGATAGAAFAAAAAGAGRYRQPLADAAGLAGLGDDPQPALSQPAELAPLAVACGFAARSGASLAGVIAGVRGDLAADRDTRRAVAAAMAGPRSSAMLLALLPVVGLGMGVALGVDPVRVLLHTGPGLISLSAGVLLNLAGLSWTLLLTRPRPG